MITTEWLAYLVALVLTALLANDSMYIMEFGQRNLFALHLFVITVSLKRFGTKISLATCIPITAIALYIMAYTDLDLPTIEPGLYHDEQNIYISNIVKKWAVDKRTYDDGRGTPWMLTGDIRTGLPFMVNNIPEQKYVRRLVHYNILYFDICLLHYKSLTLSLFVLIARYLTLKMGSST